MDDEGEQVPAGFEPLFRKSPLTDPWEPLYSKRSADRVVIGFWAGPRHTNARGFVHGGLISALADNAMGYSCARPLATGASLVTVRLSVDFLSTARIGQWVEIDTGFVKTGGTLCFAQCFITANGAVCARADAVFRVVRAVPPGDEAR
jgi:uncharacterized protein (TIGR00369 family)